MDTEHNYRMLEWSLASGNGHASGLGANVSLLRMYYVSGDTIRARQNKSSCFVQATKVYYNTYYVVCTILRAGSSRLSGAGRK